MGFHTSKNIGSKQSYLPETSKTTAYLKFTVFDHKQKHDIASSEKQDIIHRGFMNIINCSSFVYAVVVLKSLQTVDEDLIFPKRVNLFQS